jgi:hypothetical protein
MKYLLFFMISDGRHFFFLFGAVSFVSGRGRGFPGGGVHFFFVNAMELQKEYRCSQHFGFNTENTILMPPTQLSNLQRVQKESIHLGNIFGFG